jgi:hypothetical protein
MESVMIGQQPIITLRKAGFKPTTVFFFIGEPPTPKFWFNDPMGCLNRNEMPEVYTHGVNPKKADLTWAKGLIIHLIGGKDIYEYMAWWVSLIDAEPRLLIGVDTDEEVNIWR